MNRLTQKIINHLLNVSSDDLKFGRFMVGVLFGDQCKLLFEQSKLTQDFQDLKNEFLHFVEDHLVKAESLISENLLTQKNSKTNLNFNESPKKVTELLEPNSPLFTQNSPLLMRFPLESHTKLPTFCEKENNTSVLNKLEHEKISMENKKSVTINIMNKFDTSLKKSQKMPQKTRNSHITFIEPKSPIKFPRELNEHDIDLSTKVFHLFNENEYPEEYFDHWIFLRQKLRFYQNQLDDFYYHLHKIQKHKSSERIYSPMLKVRPYEFESPQRPFNFTRRSEIQLSKRSYPTFIRSKPELRAPQGKENEQLFRSMFRPIKY
jgi:hypothetical protein